MGKGQESKGPASGMMNKASDGNTAGADVSSPTDQLRGVNPMDQAEKCKIGEKINGDAARYKKGPGPF